MGDGRYRDRQCFVGARHQSIGGHNEKIISAPVRAIACGLGINYREEGDRMGSGHGESQIRNLNQISLMPCPLYAKSSLVEEEENTLSTSVWCCWRAPFDPNCKEVA
ncbi:MAG: hypothetical protein EBE86_024670 [Hormoscilla sp. GUM202]|nr:hypothetical protein [Hormoscilla sp. GUM202]